MKSVLAVAFVLAVALLVVPAVAFRNEVARTTLRKLRNAAWLLIVFILIAAAIQLWRDGGL